MLLSLETLVLLRLHGVGGMGNDRAEDAGEVARGEGYGQLRGLGILVLGLGENVLVKLFHDVLEGHELDDCVGHLSAPEWDQPFEESVVA